MVGIRSPVSTLQFRTDLPSKGEKFLHDESNAMKFRTKGFVSLLLALTFLVASFSGVILYLTPRGRVANWTGWTMLGLDKH